MAICNLCVCDLCVLHSNFNINSVLLNQYTKQQISVKGENFITFSLAFNVNSFTDFFSKKNLFFIQKEKWNFARLLVSSILLCRIFYVYSIDILLDYYNDYWFSIVIFFLLLMLLFYFKSVFHGFTHIQINNINFLLLDFIFFFFHFPYRRISNVLIDWLKLISFTLLSVNTFSFSFNETRTLFYSLNSIVTL